MTSLDLGGAARFLTEIADSESAVEAVEWARDRRLPLTVLGGGSNVVVADAGVDGLVLRVSIRGLDVRTEDDDVLVAAGAGENWDEVVADCVDRDLAGLECMSGIPGLVGATPIQNVGAYGQEVATVVERVSVLDLESCERRAMTPDQCAFGYRDSIFRRRPGRFLVLGVTFRLRPGGEPTVTYRELRKSLAPRESSPTLADVRGAVLDLRRSKSMVLDPADANRRSAGSFFVNPVVDSDGLATVERRGRASGALGGDVRIPSFDLGSDRFKVPAGWLIERSGFHRGLRRGPVGISSAHALALVHHGGGTAAELVAFARDIRDGVRRAFGIELRPEPVFLGFDQDNPLDGATF
jgi:UDP-N-acetylmuramate dehydrogenase